MRGTRLLLCGTFVEQENIRFLPCRRNRVVRAGPSPHFSWTGQVESALFWDLLFPEIRDFQYFGSNAISNLLLPIMMDGGVFDSEQSARGNIAENVEKLALEALLLDKSAKKKQPDASAAVSTLDRFLLGNQQGQPLGVSMWKVEEFSKRPCRSIRGRIS